MKKKIFSILFFILIFSGIISICLLFFITTPNENKNLIGITNSEYINYIYSNNHPRFNYIHGLFMIPIGVMIFSIIGLLEIPKKEQEIRMLILKKMIKKK